MCYGWMRGWGWDAGGIKSIVHTNIACLLSSDVTVDDVNVITKLTSHYSVIRKRLTKLHY